MQYDLVEGHTEAIVQTNRTSIGVDTHDYYCSMSEVNDIVEEMLNQQLVENWLNKGPIFESPDNVSSLHRLSTNIDPISRVVSENVDIGSPISPAPLPIPYPNPMSTIEEGAEMSSENLDLSAQNVSPISPAPLPIPYPNSRTLPIIDEAGEVDMDQIYRAAEEEILNTPIEGAASFIADGGGEDLVSTTIQAATEIIDLLL